MTTMCLDSYFCLLWYYLRITVSLLDWVWPSVRRISSPSASIYSPSPFLSSPKGESCPGCSPPLRLPHVIVKLTRPQIILYRVSVALLQSQFILKTNPSPDLSIASSCTVPILTELFFLSLPITQPNLLFFSSCLGRLMLIHFSFKIPVILYTYYFCLFFTCKKCGGH